MHLPNRIWPDAEFIHGQGHQSNPEPHRSTLNEGVCERLNAAPPTNRHESSESGRDRLPAIAREHEVARFWRPAAAGQKS